jgi:hypothetical protein
MMNELSATMEPRESWLRRRHPRRAARILGLVLFALLAAPAASPGTGHGYSSVTDLIYNLSIGLCIAFTFLAVVGSIGYWISRARGRKRSWSAVVFRPGALIVTLVLLLISGAGRTGALNPAAAQGTKASAQGSLTPREIANVDAQTWDKRRLPIWRELADGLRKERELTPLLSREGNSAKVRQLVASAEQDFSNARARELSLPTAPLAALRDLDARFVRISGLEAASFEDYTAALAANHVSATPLSQDRSAIAKLRVGDAKSERASVLFARMRVRLRVLNRAYSIPSANPSAVGRPRP